MSWNDDRIPEKVKIGVEDLFYFLDINIIKFGMCINVNYELFLHVGFEFHSLINTSQPELCSWIFTEINPFLFKFVFWKCVLELLMLHTATPP